MARAAAKKAVLSVVQIDGGASKHRTSALNLTHVPNYPKKLVIYQLAASPFWWVRYYADGKILRRSTKETDKRRAIEFAKDFYDEVNYKQRQGLVLNSRADFELCADALLEQQDAKVQRGEMSAMMQQNDRYRLQKEVLTTANSSKATEMHKYKAASSLLMSLNVIKIDAERRGFCGSLIDTFLQRK